MTVFSENAPKHDYLYFYCHDTANMCNSPSLKAYSGSSWGMFYSNHYIWFCASYWKMPTLGQLMDENKDNRDRQKVMENFSGSKGGIFFHEMWHLDMVSNPRTDDYAYQPDECWNMSRDRGTWWASENADSYHMDALAIYVQQYYSR